MAVKTPSYPAPDRIRVRRALLSVSDKAGLTALARGLEEFGVELISTGGTAAALAAEGLAVRDVSAVTGFPEILDGRVKTLHPAIHGGLLAIRDEESHRAAIGAHGIASIDLLVVNLYPFEAVRAAGAEPTAIVENIDIGGPAMLRAAAKNHAYVAVVTDPGDYQRVLAELRAGGGTLGLDLRRELAAKAFARTAAYDAAIAGWFAERLSPAPPQWRVLSGTLRESLRYGENPHQQAGFYVTDEPRHGVATAVQLQGKPLSYNNINDTDAAYELVAEFDPQGMAACAIIKHANPCGVAEADTLETAYRRALQCDPVSAFGGIVAFNRPLDEAAARALTEIFTEVIIAPEASPAARAVLAEKKNLRLLVAGGLPDPRAPGNLVRSVAGGFLVQERDKAVVEDCALKVVTRRAPSETELADLMFAFRVAKHVKSNAIVFARGRATVGIGAGQMSRIDATRIAAIKAREAADRAGLHVSMSAGSVVASDAFFPFADGLVAAAEAGATAVIQPGGSLRDVEVIAAADRLGLAMVFTGTRHFRH